MTQKVYLRKVLIYLKMLDHAFQKLNEVWAEDSQNEIDLNDYLSRLFPFDKSFDELGMDVREWVRDFSIKALDQEIDPNEPDVITKLQIEHARVGSKETFFVLFIHGDVDPELIGPYDTMLERDAKALELKAQHGDEHGIFGIYWKGYTHLSVLSYTNHFLDVELKDSDGVLCNYLNYYECKDCQKEWIDRWSCACNDKCPICHAEIEPSDTVEVLLEPVDFTIEAELLVDEKELDSEDKECLEEILTPYTTSAYSEDDALDQYHSNVPVSCLEHFDFKCTKDSDIDGK